MYLVPVTFILDHESTSQYRTIQRYFSGSWLRKRDIIQQRSTFASARANCHGRCGHGKVVTDGGCFLVVLVKSDIPARKLVLSGLCLLIQRCVYLQQSRRRRIAR